MAAEAAGTQARPAGDGGPGSGSAKIAQPTLSGTENAMLVTPLGPMGLETSTPPGALESAAAEAPKPGEPGATQPQARAPGVSGWSLLRAIQMTLLALALVSGAARC